MLQQILAAIYRWFFVGDENSSDLKPQFGLERNVNSITLRFVAQAYGAKGEPPE